MVNNKTVEKDFLTRGDSALLYGTAIILMIFHHCLCSPSRLGYQYIPVLGGFETESRIAWGGRLCVAIYAFVTGYAMAVKAGRNCESTFRQRLLADIKTAFTQLVKFYPKFWLVFLVYVPIGIIWFGRSFGIRSILTGMFIGRGGYCIEWWYVAQYIKLMLLYPITASVESCINSKMSRLNAFLISASFIAGLLLLRQVSGNNAVISGCLKLYNMLFTNYTMIFIIAYVISANDIFSLMDTRLPDNPFFNSAAILLCLIGRWLCVMAPDQSNYDIILAPLIVFFLVRLFHMMTFENVAQRVLSFLGTYSTYMWLIHSFWIYYYFTDIALLPRLSILIVIWVVAISLINAIAFDYLHNILERFCKNRQVENT